MQLVTRMWLLQTHEFSDCMAMRPSPIAYRGCVLGIVELVEVFVGQENNGFHYHRGENSQGIHSGMEFTIAMVLFFLFGKQQMQNRTNFKVRVSMAPEDAS